MGNPLFKRNSFFKNIFYSSIILVISGIFIVFINPVAGFFRPCCLFREITGFYCAGCGMSTGIHALLRGDIPAALERNILIGTAVPAAVLYLVIRNFYNSEDGKGLSTFDKSIILFFILIIIIFTICRNLPIPVFDILRPH